MTSAYTFGTCVSGCGNPNAENYAPDADIFDESLCEFAAVQGCTDEAACNFDSLAEENDGSCTYMKQDLTVLESHFIRNCRNI